MSERNYDDIDMDALIDIAEKADKTPAELEKERIERESKPRVIITGMLDRKAKEYEVSSSHIQKELLAKANRLCQGNKWAVINYVIKRGLESIEKEREQSIVECSSI